VERAEPEEFFPDWSKMPRILQQRYFELAEKEAKRMMKRASKYAEMRTWLSGMLRFTPLKPFGDWEDLVVACVDGSDSPIISSRVGVRYGLFASASMLFRGIDNLGVEDYASNYYADHQVRDPERFTKILDLLTVNYERTMALQCLKEQQPDLVMIDGSFFGYRTGCSQILREQIQFADETLGEEFSKGRQLVERITEKTLDLLKSGRALGIIKRVNTAAIDGLIAYKYGEKACVGANDRAILSALLDENSVFAYDSLQRNFLILNWFRVTARDKRGQPPDKIMDEAKRRLEVQIEADLGDRRLLDVVSGTKRFFVRPTMEQPPICVEFWGQSQPELVEKALWYVVRSKDPATGLPFPLDLVDNLVSLPRGVAKEFAEEVEAHLLRAGVDSQTLLGIFGWYNPQKEE